MHSDLLLVIVVATALAFDFTNGFHDTANVVATSISTRALSPRTAIGVAALLNFAGAFISLKVAATIATGIFDTAQITESIAFAGLFGAIAWNLITWAFGLPSSSSHALIGGITGAMLAAVGTSGVKGGALVSNVVIPAIVAPILAFTVAGVSIVVIYRFVAHRRPGLVTRGFRLGQIASGSMLALAHGTNDAQKTMGVITLALVAHGNLDPNHLEVPTWVVITSATAIALGTYAGGWRIIRTVGTRIMKINTAQGFASQSASSAVILASSHFGYPLSSTHVISGGIIGCGAAERISAVRWGVAGNITLAWVLTLPAAGVFGALTYWLIGSSATGPLVLSILGLAALVLVLIDRRRRAKPLPT